MANTLFIALQGPMQSWGERARWAVRDSSSTPTKSGVIGLLGCALGLAEDAPLRELSLALTFGVRCDVGGTTLDDYHTVVTGVLQGSGGLKRNAKTKEPETVVSWRQYLCDAAFMVALGGDQTLLERCASALVRPHWPPFLGRKSCPPTRPLYDGMDDFDDLEQALRQWPRLTPCAEPATEGLLAQVPAQPGQGLRRSDELGSRSRRIFWPRYVRQLLVYPPNPQEAPCTSPN